LWRFEQEPSLYVPQNLPLTIIFLGTLLATEIFLLAMARPALKRSDPSTG
jgi:hypothetical protein